MVIRCALLQAVRRAFLMNASSASPEWQVECTGTQPPLPQGKESTAQRQVHRPGRGGSYGCAASGLSTSLGLSFLM